MDPAPIFVPHPGSPLPPGTTVRISSRETGGDYCVCEMTTLPGDGVPLHVHDRDAEFYYVLEGIYEFTAGAESFVAGAGSMVAIPRNVPHSFRNSGTAAARALMIFRPGGFDELLDELRQAAVTGTVTASQRQAVLAKWGIKFLTTK